MPYRDRPWRLALSAWLGLLISSGGSARLWSAEAQTPWEAPPTWAQHAVWYQIFVERFRNGDPNNDPTYDSLKGADPMNVPAGWAITPWGHDWYERESWAQADDAPFHRWAAGRRYGGDLQGVLDQLDYLKNLGVNALYFNPLNDAPSLHKYDARHYRHIDRHFGPDPRGDTELMDSETPEDPETWRWTSADQLFLRLIEAVHACDMRLIVDFSWNHTGRTFWAWKDLVAQQQNSRFRNWYDIVSFDDPNTPANEFRYKGWVGVQSLPELKKIDVRNQRDGYAFEGNLQPEVKAHIFSVTRRWLDPNGDGDPSDGVDGFRLDVAPHVPLGFWRDYRKFVHSINPEALLLGEAWWTQWPDELMDPRPFLEGDVFDSVMHYQWYRPARQFFAQANGGLKPTQFVAAMKQVYRGYQPATSRALMNLAASHDSPRLATSFQNKQAYKYRMGARDNRDLNVGPPTSRTLREMRLLLLHQFTFLSAPHIWNGDERGMWGADDPDCRKPILWDDITHQPERFRPDGSTQAPHPVKTNRALLKYYRQLGQLRQARPEFRSGDLSYVVADDDSMTLAYQRSQGEHKCWGLFNRSENPQTFVLKKVDQPVKALLSSVPGAVLAHVIEGNHVKVTLEPLSGVALGTH